MATTYQAAAAVVKVSIGPAGGNRVARFIKRGGIIPEGVEQDSLKLLESRGLIEKVPAGETDTSAADAEAAAAAAAKAKAEADAKAKADTEAKAKAAADAKAAAAAAKTAEK
jgi:hypothetical protein